MRRWKQKFREARGYGQPHRRRRRVLEPVVATGRVNWRVTRPRPDEHARGVGVRRTFMSRARACARGRVGAKPGATLPDVQVLADGGLEVA
jgi:hypothetical protein